MALRPGSVFLIERFAVHDGLGIRVAVFLKGCPLRSSTATSSSASPGTATTSAI
jgi:pyruvate-formate lyase-activating enzyme